MSGAALTHHLRSDACTLPLEGTETPQSDLTEERPVAGRYRLTKLLGQTGNSRVWLATDLVLSRNVAAKEVLARTESHRIRLRREISALRQLSMPGVVRIVDDHTEGETQWILMELVEGEHFPGTGRKTWNTIAPVVRNLLEILGRIHAAGLIHRDLKPANVMVRADDSVAILDFGLSRRIDQGESLTRQGEVLGTPRYMSPEQVNSHRTDHRSDLYAVGLMIFEALTGRLPWPDQGVNAWRTRLEVRPISIQTLIPDLPNPVANAIDRLLCVHPSDRPSTAMEVLRLLSLGDGAARAPTLPLLGRAELLANIWSTLQSKQAVHLVGPRGCGASRLLEEVETQALAVGWEVLRCQPGQRAYHSLCGHSPNMFLEKVRGNLLVLADDVVRLDRRTRALLLETKAAILWVGEHGSGQAVAVPPLCTSDLIPLIAGPETFLHFPSDSATLLMNLSGGWPGTLSEVIQTWVSEGHARWVIEPNCRKILPSIKLLRGDVGHFFYPPMMDRPALESNLEDLLACMELRGDSCFVEDLETAVGRPAWELRLELEDLRQLGLVNALPDGRWRARSASMTLPIWEPERRNRVLQEIALLAPKGSPGRLHLLARSGLTQLALEEAHLRASKASEEGRHEAALATLFETFAWVRGAHPPADITSFFSQMVIAACKARRIEQLQATIYELKRADAPGPLVGLLEAYAWLLQGPAERARRAAIALSPFADVELEGLRQALIIRALGLTAPRPGEATKAYLNEIGPWIYKNGADPIVRYRSAYWMGSLAYREENFKGAIAYFYRAAQMACRADERAAALIDAGSAALEAGDLRTATDLGLQAMKIAQDIRHPALEARSTWIQRSSQARSLEPGEPELSLIEASDHLGEPSIGATLRFTEACIAWRSGNKTMAAFLATEAACLYAHVGNRRGALFSEVLATVSGAPKASEVEALAERTTQLPPRLSIEAYALLATTPYLSREARHRAQQLLHQVHDRADGERGGPLSLSEIRQLLEGNRRRPKPPGKGQVESVPSHLD